LCNKSFFYYIDDLAPIKVKLVNESDRSVIVKAAKALAKINVANNTHLNISLDLTEIERKLIIKRNLHWIEICEMNR
jgi:hypothetical protein